MTFFNPRYAPLVEFTDNIPIKTKVKAYEDAQKWPGYPQQPANPYPIIVPNISKYVNLQSPMPSPGGRVLKKNQQYAFLSNYDIYP